MAYLLIPLMLVLVICIIGASMAVADVVKEKHYNPLWQFGAYLLSIVTLTCIATTVLMWSFAP